MNAPDFTRDEPYARVMKELRAFVDAPDVEIDSPKAKPLRDAILALTQPQKERLVLLMECAELERRTRENRVDVN